MNESALRQEFVLRRLSEPVAGVEIHWLLWLALIGVASLLIALYVAWKYRRDFGLTDYFFPLAALFLLVPLAGTIRVIVSLSRGDGRWWNWLLAMILTQLRCLVYGLLMLVFLLPSCQQWERSEKRSRVVLILDVSDSITRVTDDIPNASRPAEKLETRLDKMLNFLTDKDVHFLARLMERNPVVVYRFASRLDEEFTTFEQGHENWSREAWTAWLRLDFKYWLLQGLSEPGRKTMLEHPDFAGDKPGNGEWALVWLKKEPAETIPAAGPETGFSEADRQKLLENREKLDKRIEVCRQLLQGTNVGESLLQVINREATNMVQGVILLSDGRSTQGTEAAIPELRARAKRDNIPIFSVVIGEDRLPIGIQITDVQTPEQAPPDEKFIVRAEIDGVGLPGKEKPVFLDIFRPADNPKKDKPVHTLEGKVTFQPGEPPHGQVEFSLDPTATEGGDKLPTEFFKPVKKPDPMEKKDEPKDDTQYSTGKPELLEGEWKFIVRVPKDEGEAFVGKEHVSDAVSVQVVKKPLRVLLFAGGPTHDFQFLRLLFVREKDQKRAEVSIFVQNEGRDGRDVQDVEPERRLARFPTTLVIGDHNKVDPKQKYYNLDEYDVIIAIDPDWSELDANQFQLLKTWVERQAGGLIILAGPINTFQLARADESSKLKALAELFPVVPGDSVLPVNPQMNLRRNTKKAWFLNFPGANKDMEFLKLDDEKNQPLAGWDQFFFGKEHRDGREAEAKRGFYEVYPVQSVKKGAVVIATFADPAAKMPDGSEHPFLVSMEYPQGRIVYLGSAETRRLRGYKELFYERFWIKLARYAAAGSRLRQNKRGVLVMGRQFSAGSFVRLEAQMFGADSNPLPETAEVKAFVAPAASDNPKDRKEIKLSPKRSSANWGGWFQGRHLVETPGEYKIEVPIPGTPDTLRGKFLVKESNPELDMIRPDLVALYQMAGGLEDLPHLDKVTADKLRNSVLSHRVSAEKTDKKEGDAEVVEKPSSDSPRLFFDLRSAEIIPECINSPPPKVQWNRGKIEDLWDKGPTVGTDKRDQPIVLPWLLLALVGLLSAEWLTRKLLRLA
jgi:hypothetical protein